MKKRPESVSFFVLKGVLPARIYPHTAQYCPTLLPVNIFCTTIRALALMGGVRLRDIPALKADKQHRL